MPQCPTSYQLDANGNRTRLSWPDGYYATYGYDALNRMVTVADSVSTSYLATYSYDDYSRRTNLAYANGATQAYTYTVAGDLLTLADTLNGASSNISYALGYTNAHELASEGYSNSAYEAQPTNGTDTFGAVNSLNQYPSVTLAGQAAAKRTTSSTNTGASASTDLITMPSIPIIPTRHAPSARPESAI